MKELSSKEKYELLIKKFTTRDEKGEEHFDSWALLDITGYQFDCYWVDNCFMTEDIFRKYYGYISNDDYKKVDKKYIEKFFEIFHIEEINKKQVSFDSIDCFYDNFNKALDKLHEKMINHDYSKEYNLKYKFEHIEETTKEREFNFERRLEYINEETEKDLANFINYFFR